MKEFMDLIARFEEVRGKRNGRFFEPAPSMFGTLLCVCCGHAEPKHFWLCDTCDKVLETTLCGCGAAHLPKLCGGNHGGAHFCCPPSEN